MISLRSIRCHFYFVNELFCATFRFFTMWIDLFCSLSLPKIERGRERKLFVNESRQWIEVLCVGFIVLKMNGIFPFTLLTQTQNFPSLHNFCVGARREKAKGKAKSPDLLSLLSLVHRVIKNSIAATESKEVFGWRRQKLFNNAKDHINYNAVDVLARRTRISLGKMRRE